MADASYLGSYGSRGALLAAIRQRVSDVESGHIGRPTGQVPLCFVAPDMFAIHAKLKGEFVTVTVYGTPDKRTIQVDDAKTCRVVLQTAL